MILKHPEKGIKLQKNKFAQKGLPRVLFAAEHEYNTLGYHISSITLDTPEKGCKITKFVKIAENSLPKVLFAAGHEYNTLRCHILSMGHEYESSEKWYQNRLPRCTFCL